METRENLEIRLRKAECLKETSRLVSDTDKENRKWTCENFAEKDMFTLVKNCVFILIGTICLAVIGAIMSSIIIK